MELWQVTSLCIGLVVLAVPLFVLPSQVATPLRAYHPVTDPIDTAALGIALSVTAFVAVAKLLQVPLTDVYITWPRRTAVRWGLVGVLIASIVITAAMHSIGGTLLIRYDGVTSVLFVLLVAFALALWASILEEFLMRGYLLSIVGQRWNWPAAIVVTAALFGLLHNGHATDSAGTVLYVGTAGMAGVLFAVVTIHTGNVWGAVAIHAAWNTLFSTHLLFFRTVHDTDGDALFTYEMSNVPFLFGGDLSYVAESPFAILVLGAGVGAVFSYYHRRER